MFGLITRRQLEKILDERDQHQKRALEEMAFEWARWFDKFRSLYAMLLKREKKSSEDAPSSTIVDESVPHDPPQRHFPFPNSRRGF